MALYIFSDAHLGSGTPDKEREKVARLTELLAQVKSDGDRMVILGDLFDFWFEYKHAIPKDHHEVLFMLRDLVKHGVPIDYVSGNHDFWMGDYFSTQIGVTLYRDHLDLMYDGLRFHLTHGDGLAKGDGGYRFLKRVLRNKFNIWLYRQFSPDWTIPLAKKVSGSSRGYTARRDHVFAKDYREYAERKLAEGHDCVAIGHLHIPVLERFPRGVYVNTGDFINYFTYVKVADKQVNLLSLTKVIL
jgi:UDP-2,3-diacylglucosamine hydrolase